MEVILAMVTVLSIVTGAELLKCRTSLELAVKWTVDCSAMNLSLAPPPMIIHPVAILNLSQNVFTHLVEFQFINWTDISHLDLSVNSIKTINDNAFKGLGHLIELNLMNNYIEVLSLTITNHLPKLRILNVSLNKLKAISPETFQPVPLLRQLFLANNFYLGNHLENYDNLNISFIQGLITLDLSNNSIKELSDNLLNNANHLISLNIAQNPLKRIPSMPPNIKHLNISGTSIETMSHGLFLKCYILQRLSLENMPLLKEIKPNAFSGLSNLEELYIKDAPKLNFISADAFGETIPKLRRVIISYCALTTLPKTFKPLLSKVEYLDLQGNPWTCDGRIAWLTSIHIQANLTDNLRCDKPPTAQEMLMMDYFKPRSLHPYFSLIRAGIVIAMVAILVVSVVGMIRHMRKQKVKYYQHLQDIKLQDRNESVLTPF